MRIIEHNLCRISNVLFVLLAFSHVAWGQSKLYHAEFSLNQVELKSSRFKSAMDLNIETLLDYDVDRLLEPYLTEAGLSPKGERYANWDGLAGHVGGHYLTAMAINYAATGNATCKSRLDYMLDELKRCQDKHGDGYLGGVPDGRLVWNDVRNGNFQRYWNAWVPWYNLHKIYAGLRDAWLYAENDLARTMFLDLCDWGLGVIENLSYSQMQQMLDTEFGGMNEVYADAYQMTGEKKYLEAAKRFTHNLIFDAMVAGNDNLDNKHANTQIPKIIGFARIAQLDPTAVNYAKAARFFWQTVVNNRSLALGGNSREEHFPSKAACEDYIASREGPESCNTYNMLRLTELLMSMDPKVEYVDYYERALYNHILSTQHPEHGGYVYFTPARPQHYRVYSSVNQAMWCCVGSGMENHGKYGQMIYSHFGSDSLLVNLFIPSVLKWDEEGIELEQTTQFPGEESSRLTFNKASGQTLKLILRHPAWVAEGFSVMVNGSEFNTESNPGEFVVIERAWNNGDYVDVKLPMHMEFETLPNVNEYIAFLYGPILLGARTGNDGLDGLIADDGRWAHIAGGALKALNEAPIIEGNKNDLLNHFQPVENEALTFTAPELFAHQSNYKSIVFEPFSGIHDSRYMMYWLTLTTEEYEKIIAEMEDDERERLILDQRTIDQVATGEQQPDADHQMKGTNTYNGVHMDEYYRDAREGGYFSYEMATGGNTRLTLWVRYWGNEWGNRTFDILIDGVVIATENVSGKWQVDDFVQVEYTIPSELLAEKETINVKFDAKPENVAGGVFYLRLLKPEETQSMILPSGDDAFSISIKDRIIRIDTPLFMQKNGEYRLYSSSGEIVKYGQIESRETLVNASELNKGLYILQCKNEELSSGKKLFFY